MFSAKLAAFVTVVAGVASAASTNFTYTRINRTEAALLVVDIQEGLFQVVHDMEPRAFRNNIFAFSQLGVYFDLPTIITTSAETGPNGPVPPEILADHPKAPYIKRKGEVNAWDSKEFRDAVIALDKKQLIIAGITTDACVTLLSLSLREAGYDVYVVAEASGTFDVPTAALANNRMQIAGVQVMSWFSVVGELMRDWREAPGGVEAAQKWISTYLPSYRALLNSWNSTQAHM